MFDCREDSDALWHQFRVKVMGVLDLQLLKILHRRRGTATRSQMSSIKRNPRSQRTDEVESIYGFRRCLELYVQDKEMIKIKETGSQAFKRGDKEGWKKRPLTTELLHYCVVDTMGMFKLYDKLKDAEGIEGTRLVFELLLKGPSIFIGAKSSGISTNTVISAIAGICNMK